MVGLCLIAVFAVASVAASSALAAKSPYNVNTWGQYKACPYDDAEVENCFAGITEGGSKGGYFEYGKVKVKLNQPVALHGGYKGAGSEIEVVPARSGYETLEAPPLKVTGGIGLLTKQIQQSAQWPAALTESWKEAKKNKESTVFAKIEMAGDECFEVPGCLDTENLIFEGGVAFRLPLKVKVTGPWLEKLGGGPCEIGNDENPIHINLTTEGSGRSGEVKFNEPNFLSLAITNTKLVDLGWHIPVASRATGCGGEYEKYVDRALNIALEVENGGQEGSEIKGRTGIVVLQGSTYNGSVEGVTTEGFESGELP
jgi:hypothetical protein